MKVIDLSEIKEQELQDFLSQIPEGIRPGMFIGFTEDHEPILFTTDMSWRDLSYLKMCLDMYLTENWMGLDEE